MKLFRRIISYLPWITLAVFIGITYTFFYLRHISSLISNDKLRAFVDILFFFEVITTGIILGSCISVIYILLDSFYLKKKLAGNKKSFILRLSAMAAITLFIRVIQFIFIF